MAKDREEQMQESIRWGRIGAAALAVGAAVLLLFVLGHCSEVQWSRFKGKVKGINGKTSLITIQNGEGDLITVKVDDDVEILDGKDAKHLRDLSIDDKVTLVYSPKAPTPKDVDEPAGGGIYAPARK